MKTEKRSNGWDDVTTKSFNVTLKAKAFQPASHWVDFVRRHPTMDTLGRNHCERCKNRWKDSDPEMMTYFVMTDKGNKVVCQFCWDEIEAPLPLSKE